MTVERNTGTRFITLIKGMGDLTSRDVEKRIESSPRDKA
jgi:hypothetical protein